MGIDLGSYFSSYVFNMAVSPKIPHSGEGCDMMEEFNREATEELVVVKLRES